MDSDGSHITAGCLIIAALIAARVFFTCCETSCTEINDAKVKGFENEKGAKGLLFRLLKNPCQLMHSFAAHRVLNEAAVTVSAVYVFFTPLYVMLGARTDTDPHGRDTGLAFVCMAVIVLFSVILLEAFGDSLPKKLMLTGDTSAFAVFSAPAAALLNIVIRPITVVSDAISGAAAMLFGRNADIRGESVTEEEILLMVDAGNETGSIESSEREMINNVFEFHELTVSDVMTHRTDIVAISADSEISEAVYTAINSGFSRIPVYRDSIDHIEGLIYVKDLLCLIGTQASEGTSVRTFLRDAEFVPESCMCGELLKKLTEKKLQLAVAVDEYGGTAGLVTMEDLLESIVGNIQDEYDNEAEELTEISENIYTLSGTADPADVMEVLGESLPDGSDYDTMSGFITDLLGRIPDDGETPSVTYKSITFTVLLAEDMRIARIKAVINRNETKKDNKDNTEKEIIRDENSKEKKA